MAGTIMPVSGTADNTSIEELIAAMDAADADFCANYGIHGPDDHLRPGHDEACERMERAEAAVRAARPGIPAGMAAQLRWLAAMVRDGLDCDPGILEHVAERLKAMAADRDPDPHAAWRAEAAALDAGVPADDDLPDDVAAQMFALRDRTLRTEARTLAGARIQVELIAENLRGSSPSERDFEGLANVVATLRRWEGR